VSDLGKSVSIFSYGMMKTT